MPSAPESIVRSFVAALDAHDLDQAVRQLAPAYRGIDISRSTTAIGRDEAREDLRAITAAFSNLSMAVKECVGDGPQISVLWELSGHHSGSCLHIPPTHRPVTLSGMAFVTAPDTHITQCVYQWDLAGFLRSVKLLPDLPDGDIEGPVPVLSSTP
jgi:predicted ester cyclase